MKNASKKFHNQFEAVESAIALARYRDGYSSPQIVQIIGPHVVAKPKMKKHAKQIIAMEDFGVFSGFVRSREKWPTEAKMRKQINIQAEPAMRDSSAHHPILGAVRLEQKVEVWTSTQSNISDAAGHGRHDRRDRDGRGLAVDTD